MDERRFWNGEQVEPDRATELFIARRPRFVLVAGLPNAGKSSLLAASYLAIASGLTSEFSWRFCHSRTLRGWERLGAPGLQWTGDGPILSRTAQPGGLFHLAFKPRLHPGSSAVSNRVVDVVFGDFPGESFAHWADSSERGGELPLNRVDCFWVVVDLPDTLANRAARSRAASLLDRVVDVAGVRPIALVLAKADLVPEIPKEPGDPIAWGTHRASVERLLGPLRRHRSESRVYAVSALPTAPTRSIHVLGPLEWSLGLPVALPASQTARNGARYFTRFAEEIPVLR